MPESPTDRDVPVDRGPGGGRTGITTRGLPTWSKVIAVGAGVVLVVGFVALIALLVPPIGEAIRGAPVMVIVLVVGTVVVLGATIRSATRRR